MTNDLMGDKPTPTARRQEQRNGDGNVENMKSSSNTNVHGHSKTFKNVHEHSRLSRTFKAFTNIREGLQMFTYIHIRSRTFKNAHVHSFTFINTYIHDHLRAFVNLIQLKLKRDSSSKRPPPYVEKVVEMHTCVHERKTHAEINK